MQSYTEEWKVNVIKRHIIPTYDGLGKGVTDEICRVSADRHKNAKAQNVNWPAVFKLVFYSGRYSINLCPMHVCGLSLFKGTLEYIREVE